MNAGTAKMETERRIFLSKKSAAAVFILCVVICSAMAYLIKHSSAPLKPMISFYVMAVFSVAGAFACAINFFDNEPKIILNRDGLWFKTRKYKDDFIFWADISYIGEKKLNHNKFILIFLKDPQRFLYSRKSMAYSFANKYFGTPVAFYTSLYTISHKEMLALIEERLYESVSAAQ